MRPEFVAYPKTLRLTSSVLVTEKIDGSNAQIVITPEGEVFAGSRNRYLTIDNDNFGFAQWVDDHKVELLGLGVGTHYGEWWGKDIQRGYGMDTRVFSLFNATRWVTAQDRPSCCSVVPILMHHTYSDVMIADVLNDLRNNGSKAAPGFMKPEGIIVSFGTNKGKFKVMLEGNDTPKSLQKLAEKGI